MMLCFSRLNLFNQSILAKFCSCQLKMFLGLNNQDISITKTVYFNSAGIDQLSTNSFSDLRPLVVSSEVPLPPCHKNGQLSL